MNKKGVDSSRSEVLKEESKEEVQKESKEKESTRKRKLGDLTCSVYQLVMNRFQDEILEGFDRVLWGDLMVMLNPDDENEIWNSQLDWNISLKNRIDSTMVLELIKFIKKILAELEPEE
ncbi:hypothetical protein Tco_0684024 [Tanacetum coccineum]